MSLPTIFSTLPNKKQRGELAEAEFLARAFRLGFIVSRPWGDSAPYDLIVQPCQRLYRIQVKSAWKRVCNRYTIHSSGHNHRRYFARDFEFMAAYVAPYDAWYIIPKKAVAGRVSINFYLTAREAKESTKSSAKPGIC